MDIWGFTTFLTSSGWNNYEKVQLLAKTTFGVSTNSRLITLKTRFLARKRTKINIFQTNITRLNWHLLKRLYRSLFPDDLDVCSGMSNDAVGRDSSRQEAHLWEVVLWNNSSCESPRRDRAYVYAHMRTRAQVNGNSDHANMRTIHEQYTMALTSVD